jgi:hypothetical protein
MTQIQRGRRGVRAVSLRVAALLLGVVLAGGVLVATDAPARAATGCAAATNPVTCENALPGTPPSAWDIEGAGDDSIQGFSTDISVASGETMGFKIDTDATAYSIDLYRTGWYQGLGARKVAEVTPSAALPQVQPVCLSDQQTELYDCGNWALSASWTVPSDAVSGVYIALLTRADTGGQSHITFVVRNDDSRSAVLFQTSDPTWQAYNAYGGSNFYQGGANGRAYKISYNRPVTTRDGPGGRDFYFSNEYPMVRFLEKNGYDVSYFSGVDTDRFGDTLVNHDVFLSVGHDEYWSAAQRENVEAARDAGVNLQFLSGNEVYWKTRYEASTTAGGDSYRTLVSYKETWSNDKIDPSPEWTGTWRDPRFAPTERGGGRPENELTGTLFQSNYSDLPVTVSAEEGRYRLWRNTSLASLPAGSRIALAEHTVGYESDEDPDNGFRPDGLIRLSTTVGPVPEYLQDFGNVVKPGTTTHNVTLYRAPSGALVFSAGSVQWTWGLDQTHDGNGAPADIRMQQAQVNLLADMGAQPDTLAADLVPATQSTDTTPPTATISSPAAGATVPNGSAVTVTGTAVDTGGGIVAAVEVSTDGGDQWHRATGTTTWTYSYLQQGIGAADVRVRAVDDSANFPATPTVRALTSSGPYTVFGELTPPTPDSGDASSVELGLRLTPSRDGFIAGVRFFKSGANTGAHTGSLWDSSGARLATVAFGDESASGWQSASFNSPVRVTAGSVYVVSYSAPSGHYAVTTDYWAYRGIPEGPLTVAGGYGTNPGVYNTTVGSFPESSYRQSNYFVDAVFTEEDSSPLTATSQWPSPGAASVPLDTVISAVLSRDVAPSSVMIAVTDPLGETVDGSTGYDPDTRTATFTPATPLDGFVTYSVVLAATATGGAGELASGGSWSFTTVRPPPDEGLCPCGLYTDATVPTVLEFPDQGPLTLGTRFSSSASGIVTGIRFYKSTGNTGIHTGTLWNDAGDELATATFTDETSSGWQTASFDTPVQIQAGTTYIASYTNPTGRYSATPGEFSGNGITRGPLTAGNSAGAYSYSTGYPGSASGTGYLVDVVFDRTAEPINVAEFAPADGAVDVDPAATVSAVLSAPIAPGYSLSVSAAAAPVPGSTSLSSDGTTVTFAPTQPLPQGAVVTATLSGVTSLTGAALPTRQWSFSTRDADAPVQHTLMGSATPTVPAATDDASAVEVGTSFSSSVPGTIRSIRFFKGPGNTGIHRGSIWSATGERLATVTFTGETATGWQTARLATPLAIAAGVIYTVSYLAPAGHYSYTPAYFDQAQTSGPLTAEATTNGRYLYGADGGLPVYYWNATNYFVDVVFTP